jgi:hypothetical protein
VPFVNQLMIGYKDKALEVSTDPEQRFELALQLNKLDIAYQLAERKPQFYSSHDQDLTSNRSGSKSVMQHYNPGI